MLVQSTPATGGSASAGVVGGMAPAGAAEQWTLWRVCPAHVDVYRACGVCDGSGFVPVMVWDPGLATLVGVACPDSDNPSCRCLLCHLVDVDIAYVARTRPLGVPCRAFSHAGGAS